MDVSIRISGSRVDTYPDNHKRLTIEVEDVPKSDLLEHLSVEDCIEHFGKNEFLEEIGIDECKVYFDLTDNEE